MIKISVIDRWVICLSNCTLMTVLVGAVCFFLPWEKELVYGSASCCGMAILLNINSLIFDLKYNRV